MFGRHSASQEVLRCSFCQKTLDEVEKLIANPSDPPLRVYICDECIAVCSSILQEGKKEDSA